MLNNNIFYHGIIRKTIVAFGSLFSNIYIDRRKIDKANDKDSVTGDIEQRIQVPIAYAPKEKWLVRLEQDPSLENQTYTTLPRMSFEITGMAYDSNRKLNRMNQIACYKDGEYSKMFAPVPYNIDISLYVLTKTQEDGMQVIEQILPYFTPEFTLSIKSVQDMNVVTDVPIVLTSVSVQDDYDGDFQTRRFVTYTLTFQLKVNLFGPVDSGKPITKVIAQIDGPARALYVADQDTPISPIIENWEEDNF